MLEIGRSGVLVGIWTGQHDQVPLTHHFRSIHFHWPTSLSQHLHRRIDPPFPGHCHSTERTDHPDLAGLHQHRCRHRGWVLPGWHKRPLAVGHHTGVAGQKH
jgi:hypothetical protein